VAKPPPMGKMGSRTTPLFFKNLFYFFIVLFYIYFKILNNILLFYINLDRWHGCSGWMKMNGQDFKKKLMGNFQKLLGIPVRCLQA
jgi:hypothetical protein